MMCRLVLVRMLPRAAFPAQLLWVLWVVGCFYVKDTDVCCRDIRRGLARIEGKGGLVMGCAVLLKLYICCWLRKVMEMFGRRLLLRPEMWKCGFRGRFQALRSFKHLLSTCSTMSCRATAVMGHNPYGYRCRTN